MIHTLNLIRNSHSTNDGRVGEGLTNDTYRGEKGSVMHYQWGKAQLNITTIIGQMSVYRGCRACMYNGKVALQGFTTTMVCALMGDWVRMSVNKALDVLCVALGGDEITNKPYQSTYIQSFFHFF